MQFLKRRCFLYFKLKLITRNYHSYANPRVWFTLPEFIWETLPHIFGIFLYDICLFSTFQCNYISIRRSKNAANQASTTQTPAIPLPTVTVAQSNHAFTIDNEYMSPTKADMAHSSPIYDYPKEPPPSYTEDDTNVYSNVYEIDDVLPVKVDLWSSELNNILKVDNYVIYFKWVDIIK